MTAASFIIPVLARAESIALLHLLHSVPVLPSFNPTNSSLAAQEGYVLSFNQERCLVSILAFLANAKDDPNHIPALCVQESADTMFLNVLLAVNKTGLEDGKQVLNELRQGFEQIFSILSETDQGKGSHELECRIFTAIVSMCSFRILCRLRFAANCRNKWRKPFKTVLQEAIHSLEQLESEALHNQLSTIASFVEKAKTVVCLADSWAKYQEPAQLRDLIEGVYHLRQIEGLQVLIDSIPNSCMCPSSRKSLINIVTKVSRYREAARFLYRTAQRFHLVRQMKVVLVNLPKGTFDQAATDDYTPSLTSTIERIDPVRQQLDISHLSRLLQVTEMQMHKQFVHQTQKTLRKAKIHAEIQIVYHCELKGSVLPPRVICSSKDACFLCNAFILMHGKIHMPRYHGRLYPGWRLPLIPHLMNMEQNLNSLLEDRVRNSLNTLFSRQKRTIYPDPNESTLLTLPASKSTLCALVLPEATNGEKEQGGVTAQSKEPTLGHDPLIPLSTQSSTISSTNIQMVCPTTNPRVRTPEAKYGVETETSKRSVSPLAFQNHRSFEERPRKRTANMNRDLVQGSISSGSVAFDSKPQVYTAGPLKIFVEYMADSMSTTSGGPLKHVDFDIEWLPVEKTMSLLEKRAVSVIDAEGLEGEVCQEIDDQKCLYIAAHGAMVKIVRYLDSDGLRNEVVLS